MSVGVGATLTLDNQTVSINVPNRVNTSANLTLNGGNFTFNGNSGNGFASTQTLGQIILAGGNSTITMTDGTGSASTLTLKATQLVRTANSGTTVNFVSNNVSLGTTANRVLFTGTAPSLVSGVLPWATVNNSDLFTYGANGIARIRTHSATFTGTTSSSNLKITANQIIPANTNVTINGLVINGNVTISLGANSTLTIGGGGLMTTGGGTATIIGGTVAFGSSEALISTNEATSLQSTVTGSGGLTLFGSNTLTLAAANTISGTTNMNSGTLSIGTASSIASGNLNLIGGTFQAAASVTLNNLFFMNNSSVTFGNNNMPLTFTNTGTISGLNTLTFSNAAGTYFNGVITSPNGGSGSLILAGGSPAFLNAANTYVGYTLLSGALVYTNNAGAFGSGTATSSSSTAAR